MQLSYLFFWNHRVYHNINTDPNFIVYTKVNNYLMSSITQCLNKNLHKHVAKLCRFLAEKKAG